MKRMWILTFRRAIAADDGEIVVIETCGEDELQSVKERLAMQLEQDSGEPWRCAEIRAFEAKRKEREG